ncbi:MAG: Serine/threonine-protein kinase Chk1 [Marteilia pararefringens]
MHIDENYKRLMIKIEDTSPTHSQPPVKKTKRNIFSQSSVDDFQSDLPDVSKDDSSESRESANDFVIDFTSPNNYWSLSQPLETFAHKSILSSTLSPPNSASTNSVYSQVNEDLLSQMTQNDNSDDIVDIRGLPSRMSRIFFTNNIETISRALRDIISFYNAKITNIINNSIRATQQLSNSNKVDFMVIFIKVKRNVVLCEFRRTNGCGLQFRKLFRKIRNSFKSICI